LGRGIDDALAVLVDGIAEAHRSLDQCALGLKLVGERHVARVELPCADGVHGRVALEVVEVLGQGGPVLAGRHTECLGPEERIGRKDRQALVAELVSHHHVTASEPRLLPSVVDPVARQLGAGIVDPLTVLVHRVAEAHRPIDYCGLRLELVGEEHRTEVESQRALLRSRSVALEVIQRRRVLRAALFTARRAGICRSW